MHIPVSRVVPAADAPGSSAQAASPSCRSSGSISGRRPRNATKPPWPAAAAELEDRLRKRRRCRVEDAVLLESAECVRRQHLGPLVAVVAGRVPASEDVLEAVGKRFKAGAGTTATSSRTSASVSATRGPCCGEYSACRRRSNSANSSWRTICIAAWKLRVACRRSSIASGSGLARAVVRGNQRQHLALQAKFSMNWLGSSTASQGTPLMPATLG